MSAENPFIPFLANKHGLLCSWRVGGKDDPGAGSAVATWAKYFPGGNNDLLISGGVGLGVISLGILNGGIETIGSNALSGVLISLVTFVGLKVVRCASQGRNLITCSADGIIGDIGSLGKNAVCGILGFDAATCANAPTIIDPMEELDYLGQLANPKLKLNWQCTENLNIW